MGIDQGQNVMVTRVEKEIIRDTRKLETFRCLGAARHPASWEKWRAEQGILVHRNADMCSLEDKQWSSLDAGQFCVCLYTEYTLGR